MGKPSNAKNAAKRFEQHDCVSLELGSDCIDRSLSIETALLQNRTLQAEIVLAAIADAINSGAKMAELEALVLSLGQSIDTLQDQGDTPPRTKSRTPRHAWSLPAEHPLR